MKPLFSRCGVIPALFVLALGGIAAPRALAQTTNPSQSAAPQLARRPFETAFQLPNLTGDPFDFTANDVRAQIRQPDGKILSLPAFFDGGTTWRVRHTPNAAGQYEIVSLTRNGAVLGAIALPRTWRARAVNVADFVRLDPTNPRRFVRGGARYFPLGHNQAWRTSQLPDIPELFGKMGAAGENWSRVWMNHWDGKNLDWLGDGRKPGPFGTLSLGVSRRWDGIVDAAQQNGIAFQMVLQHHGQYSSEVNPNWNENPYNVKNGGFLNAPEEFFTDARARELTKRKLRYAVARWGFSPSIMAWELWNEVQFTDAARKGQWDDIAAWHREMAAFLRDQDAYDHLITTSASGALPAKVQTEMDFYQEHLYPADVMNALNEANADADLSPDKPFFVGEFGPKDVHDITGVSIHAGLWAGILSGEAGAPQFWTWDDVERHDHYPHFRAAASFVNASGLAQRDNVTPIVPALTTTQRTDLSFGAGGDWGPVKQNEFSVSPTGSAAGIGSLSRYVQGHANRNLGPKPLVFRVAFAQKGRFIVHLSEISKSGAHLKLAVDGQVLAERAFPATAQNARPQGEAGRLAVEVPAGAHVVSLENTGDDWAALEKFTLTDYTPILGAYALSGPDSFLAWIYHRNNLMAAPGSAMTPVSGQLAVPSLQPGRYRATWWDTLAGRVLRNDQISVSAYATPSLATPSIGRDVALFVVPESK